MDVEEGQEAPENFHKRLLREVDEDLPKIVGSIYTEAVRECLTVDGSAPDAAAREILCWKVYAALDQCRA